jgi:hypothetical protein
MTHNELRRSLIRTCIDKADEHYIRQLLADNPVDAGHHLGMQNLWHSRARKYLEQIN